MKLIRNWPILSFYLQIPFVSIRTMLLGRIEETRTYQYVRVDIRLLKWSFEFNLYKPIIQTYDPYATNR